MSVCSLVGESRSTLGASSLQYFSAVGSRHSLTEAVFFASLSFLRLISSLHQLAPPLVVGKKYRENFSAFTTDRIIYDIKKNVKCFFK